MLQPIEQFEFGGVDSRSNPLNMPVNRCLRALNWVPKQDGHMELRWGYSTESMSTISAIAIHTMVPYQSWDASQKFLLVGQGTAVSVHDLTAHTDSTPAVRGAAIASSNKWGFYQANNRIHLGNGVDQKFFDGVTLRDNGLRAPTAAEVLPVVIAEGVRELSAAENSAITLTVAGGGGIAATTKAGILVYVVFFNTGGINELGPATLFAGSGRVVVASGSSKITVSIMPVPTSATWVKLLARTVDSGTNAYFDTNSSSGITSCTRSGTTLTVISSSHGLSSGDVVILTGTTSFDAVYAITVTNANVFTINLPVGTGANSTGGLVNRIVKAANATTSIDLVDGDGSLQTAYIVNQDRGLAASVIGGANPGYQFYASLYNSTTQHVGNRIAIGGRYAPTRRANVILNPLPGYIGIDSEWSLIIGRTGDGAQVPYVITDAAGNFIANIPSQSNLLITSPQIDGRYEMPTRNGVIPSQCTMFARVGDKCYAADPKSPTIRWCGSELDDRLNQFLGRPEQSWAPDDIETFPTAEAVTGIDEVDYELFVGTLRDCAILTDQNGQPVWRGPWNIGLAGPRARCKASPYGYFWVTGDKQLATFVNGLPTAVSEEYEAAELGQIGDAYLGVTELVYFRDPTKGKDEIRIESCKADGSPYTVIHDFKLRDTRSPFGQGYGATFAGPLTTPFTVISARDLNGRLQVFAGGGNGRLYEMYQGANDADNEFSADAIFLINAGQQRLDVPYWEWYGDGNTLVSAGKTLSTTLNTSSNLQFALLNSESGQLAVPGAEDDAHWRVTLSPPEIQSHIYIRFQLTSHSADGSLSLNNPPHVPLETYGRIYEVVPVLGEARGK